MGTSPPLVELRNLTKAYEERDRRRTVLREASVALARGEPAVLPEDA